MKLPNSRILLGLISVALTGIALADTPPPGAVKVKGSGGNTVTSTTSGGKEGLDVNVINGGGTSTVNQGTGGVSPWLVSQFGAPWAVSVSNFPSGLALDATLSALSGKFGSLGQKAMSGSAPVVLASDQSAIPVTGTFFQATQPVSGPLTDAQLRASPVGVSGAFFQATQPVSGPLTDAQLRASSVPVSGPLTDAQLRATPVPVSGTVATGGLTDTQLRATPVPVSGTVTANIGTSGSLALDTSVLNLSAKFGSLGQKLMTGSAPVVIASDQSAIPVTGTFFQATQPVSGPLTDTQLRASAVPVSGTFFQTTQPVSVATLPLPSNAAIESGGHLASMDLKMPVLGQALAAGSVPVVLTAAQIATLTPLSSVTVTQATGTNLHVVVDSAPSTAVTGTVTANAGTNLNTSALALSATQTDGTQKTQINNGANTAAVKAASTAPVAADPALVVAISPNSPQSVAQASTTSGQIGTLVQGAVTTNSPSYTTGQTSPVSLNVRGAMRHVQAGGDTAQIVRNDYSSVNVTTAAYVQLVASTTANINRIYVFDSSGQDFVLATGAAASEVDQIQIPPGGWDSPVDIFIASGTRLSIKSKSATASSGILLITGVK